MKSTYTKYRKAPQGKVEVTVAREDRSDGARGEDSNKLPRRKILR